MPLPTVWGFLLLCVTQGSGENWQKPASLVVPTPALHPISVRRQSRQRLSEFFLAAQRRTASAVKKKLPRGNPWKGFPLDSFPNRGAAFSAMRSPVPHCSPPRKDFCRAKMPCGGQVFQICCSAGKSLVILQTRKCLQARKRVLPKPVEDCPIGQVVLTSTPRDLKRAAALLLPKESKENPSQGFSLGNFFLTANAVLLCAAKKNGVGSWTS